MDFLIDGLPHSALIGEYYQSISTGYRTWIKFERLLRSKKSDAEKLEEAIGLCLSGAAIAPEDMAAAVEEILKFYRCGRPAPTKEEVEKAKYEAQKPRSFDFEHDAGYVYSAFRQAYQIDLVKENIHWWQFRALFEALPDTVKLVKIIGYRTAEVPKNATDEQRQEIERLKHEFALPEDPDQAKLKSDLENAIRSGGNIAALIEEVRQNGLRRNTEI